MNTTTENRYKRALGSATPREVCSYDRRPPRGGPMELRWQVTFHVLCQPAGVTNFLQIDLAPECYALLPILYSRRPHVRTAPFQSFPWRKRRLSLRPQ